VVLYAKPTDKALQGVNAWLSQNGVQSQSISPAGDRLRFTLPASKANQMFQATFAKFLHTETGTLSFQTLSYSIPAALKDAIQSAEPTTSFLNPVPPTAQSPLIQSSISARQANCTTHVTPACIEAQYHLPKIRSTNQKNVLGVPGFLKEYANYADLNVSHQ
jgi:tripeptidyl-peptidase-1